MAARQADYDVAIIGGGPGGSTTGSLLRKYNPELRVLILEREIFPRDHVGESQLPVISSILHEMGAWDKVEAANFPIKVGGTYRWGKSPELWDFEFLPLEDFQDEPRPSQFSGQRLRTAFQVDRAIYDEILLDHAAELGCEVREGTGVARIERDGDSVTGLKLANGETITARYYVDASGNAATLRRAMGVPIDCPTQLKNIAIWDYWDNAEWAIEIGVGATRIQIMSVGFGWLWFIPLSPTRTSIGLVCPAEYYKSSGKTPEQLYSEAVHSDERISALTASATREGKIKTTNDWSFVAERTVGENWFLVGECAGFADPILSAGLALTTTGARELAYTILELFRGEQPGDWLTRHYDSMQRERVRQHMRFAEFWYSTNGQFTELQEHCREIARDAGLDLNAGQSWAWLAQGGFATDVVGQVGLGGLGLTAIKMLAEQFTGDEATWRLNNANSFELDLADAVHETTPEYRNGRIYPVDTYRRGDRRLVAVGFNELILKCLATPLDIAGLVRRVMAVLKQRNEPHPKVALQMALQVLEVMMDQGWVRGRFEADLPRLAIEGSGKIIHPNRDPMPH